MYVCTREANLVRGGLSYCSVVCCLDIGEVYDDGSVAFDLANDVVVDDVSVQAEESAFSQQGRRSSRSTAGRRKTSYFGRSSDFLAMIFAQIKIRSRTCIHVRVRVHVRTY